MSSHSTVSVPETLRDRHVKAMRAAAPAMIERIGWPTERLSVERRRGLQALLRHAKERSAWHRSRLADVDPARFLEEDMRVLPTMTKEDVMANFDRIVTDQRIALAGVEAHLSSLTDAPRHLLDRYMALASSGSTGVRGVFLYDWDAWVACYLGWLRYLLRDIGGQPLLAAAVAAGKPAHISRALLQTFADPEMVAVSSLPVTLPTERLVKGLNDTQPDAIMTYPSALVQLIDARRRGELQIAPRVLVTGGEPLLPEIRAAADDAFGVPVLNWWICSEAGPVGIGCGHGPWLHLSDDLLIIEPVDDENHPVEVGRRSAKVLLTSLYNPLLPLIRYELTDEITIVDGHCPCGSQHRLIEDPYGRLDDGFRYANTIVHPHLFRSILASEPRIIEYQVRQTHDGAKIAIRGEADTQTLTQQLRRGLQDLGLTDPQISITTVTEIEREATGKIRRFQPMPDDRQSHGS